MSEPWRSRPHDHLVEPLFGGLGHEPPAEDAGASPVGSSLRRALWVVLAAVVLALVIVILAL